MMNWFRDSHGAGHAGTAIAPGYIRIAFPSFSIGRTPSFDDTAADLSVSREEIAEMLKRELK